MRRSIVLMLFALTALAASAAPARAWGNRGHEIVALIAYHELDGMPAVQAKIQAILKKHPDYETYLSKNPPKGIELEDCVVMRAATWPDWVRPRAEYHRATWHYVNKPLLIDADATTRLKVEQAFSNPKENHGDILIAFPDCRRVVGSATATDKDRAVRLCWVFHLLGDVHQPLHAVAYCNRDFPKGDLGGNNAWVRRKPNLNPTRLHTLWDHLLDGEGDDAVVTSRDIKMTVTATAAERKIKEIGDWAEESYELAKSNAYMFNGQPIEFNLDADREAPSDAPVVPTNYEKEAIKVARKRVLLAGLRLADVLKADLGG